MDGKGNEFSPTSSHWYSSSVINPGNSADLNAKGTMKNEGWSTVTGNKLELCYGGPFTDCAVFTHNRNMTLANLFATQFLVSVTENHTFSGLIGLLGVGSSFHQYSTTLMKERCGLNFGDGCDANVSPNTGGRHTISRIGCIGDQSLNRCQLDDFALGVGVNSCTDGYGCKKTEANTKNLFYSDFNIHGNFQKVVFIYVQ